MGKKAERNATRRAEAMRRMRLQTFISILIPMLHAWTIGLKGGGYDGYVRYNAIEAAPKERRYILMQCGRISKLRDKLVKAIGLESFRRIGNAFFETADRKLVGIAEKIIESLPEEQTHFDQSAIMTYIIYAAFHDYAELEDDRRPELKALISSMKAMANHLIPAGSHLCAPLNAVYWSTRDDLQQTTDWTFGGTLNWQPSEDEKAMGIA